MTLLTILLLGCVTFGTRYFFLEGKLPVRLGPNVRLFLSFSGPAVLMAICMPILFVHNLQLDTSPSNPYLWGAAATTVAAYKNANIYWTVGLGIIIFVLSGYIL
ncbi:AzlD domain-containing protein [SAR92 clade bacterium H921]|jgi:branched-subunit amino acid transport protein|nr:AzlD domain-containing protein [SAR92 clade bacterium H921]MDG0971567.1 AzlD domain-containing protein [Porticoccaceae bacterium]MDG1307615.1 AzlD domain-containing protein [Porticoccaceae bacterium]